MNIEEEFKKYKEMMGFSGGAGDQCTAAAILVLAEAIDEEKLDDYRKAKRQQLIDEVQEIRSFDSCVKKRVLAAIVNDAVRSVTD